MSWSVCVGLSSKSYSVIGFNHMHVFSEEKLSASYMVLQKLDQLLMILLLFVHVWNIKSVLTSNLPGLCSIWNLPPHKNCHARALTAGGMPFRHLSLTWNIPTTIALMSGDVTLWPVTCSQQKEQAVLKMDKLYNFHCFYTPMWPAGQMNNFHQTKPYQSISYIKKKESIWCFFVITDGGIPLRHQLFPHRYACLLGSDHLTSHEGLHIW